MNFNISLVSVRNFSDLFRFHISLHSAAIYCSIRISRSTCVKNLRLIPEYEKSIKICGENSENFCGEFGCKKQPQILVRIVT